MQVALIYPECYDIAHFGVKRKEMPPFGVLYLAAVLEREEIKVTILKATNENYKFDLSNYDIVGFSISSSVTYPIMKKLRDASQFSEVTLLIAGGIHTILYPKQVITEMQIDIACIGEAEETIVEIINEYPNSNYGKIKGIAYKGNRNIIFTEPRELIKDLDSLPFPARHLIPKDDIIVTNRLENLKIAHILCSRGCPYSCNFCANLDHEIRYRSGDNIREELEYLIATYEIEGFCITDDNFIVNKENLYDILKKIEPLNLKWSSLSRVNTVDSNLLNRMKKSGCIEIKYGIESGSQRILDIMNKQITIDQIMDAINITYDAGISVKAFILHGFPGENIESTKETIELLEKIKSKVNRISLFNFMPLPGSEVYNNFKEYKLELPQSYEDIHIYNNCRGWWGDENAKREVKKSFMFLEEYINSNWGKH